MKISKHHYSNYLISVPFDNGFLPHKISGMIAYCKNFLEDLGKLARTNGKRLHANYSIVSGKNGYHAHFAVSWLPLRYGYLKTSKNGNKRIERLSVIRMLEQNFFYVDNITEAIKRVTHDKKYVTNYVVEQPKTGQATIYSAFYSYHDFVPGYSETKMRPYCSKHQITFSRQSQKKTNNRTFQLIILISILEIVLISLILLSLF